jgi:hypothetical protein
LQPFYSFRLLRAALSQPAQVPRCCAEQSSVRLARQRYGSLLRRLEECQKEPPNPQSRFARQLLSKGAYNSHPTPWVQGPQALVALRGIWGVQGGVKGGNRNPPYSLLLFASHCSTLRAVLPFALYCPSHHTTLRTILPFALSLTPTLQARCTHTPASSFDQLIRIPENGLQMLLPWGSNANAKKRILERMRLVADPFESG